MNGLCEFGSGFVRCQKKAREDIQHKEFWGPQKPPLRNSLRRPFSCSLKGKEAPNIKNLRGQGSLGGGGLGGGVSTQIPHVYHAVGNYYLKYSWEYSKQQNMHYIFLYCGQPKYFR